MNEIIVVTGLGIVSPLGSCVETATRSLAGQRSGVAKNGRFGTEHFLGAVEGFDIADYINPSKARRMDPINCFTIAAGRQALN